MSGRTTTLKVKNEFKNAERWLENQATRNTDQNAKQKRIALEQFDDYLTEYDLTIEDIDNDLLEEFSFYLEREKGLAHSTLRGRWYDVRSYLNRWYDDDLGHLNNGDWILEWTRGGTETEFQNDEDIFWLPIEDINKLIDAAKNTKTRMVCELLWNTGCRPSEVARMRLDNVFRDERRIRVKTSKVQDPSKDNYRRDVYYSRSMRSTMRKWLDHGERASHPHADESEFLVVGYNTPSISARQIGKIVRDTAERAGIQEDSVKRSDGVQNYKISPKILRHSFAVHSVRGVQESGTEPIDIRRLQSLMGHRSLEHTSQYLNFRKRDVRDAYDRSHPA